MTMSIYSKLEALYWAADSTSIPMKMYRGYMIEQIQHSDSSQLAAWRIAHIVTGILAYPVLVPLAVLDMGIKLARWQFREKPSENFFVPLLHQIHDYPASCKVISATYNPTKKANVIDSYEEIRRNRIAFGPETIEDGFKKSKLQYIAEMQNFIHQCEELYTQVRCQYEGSWKDGITFSFEIESIPYPYCSNPLLPRYEEIKLPATEVSEQIELLPSQEHSS